MNTGEASPKSSAQMYHGRGGAYTLSPRVFFLSRAFALSLLALLIACDFSLAATAVVAMFASMSLFGLVRQHRVSMSIDDQAITMPGHSRHPKGKRFPLSSIESLRAFPLPHGVALWVTSGNGNTDKEVLSIIVSYEVFDRIRLHLSQLDVPLLGIPQQTARRLKNAVFAGIAASLMIGVVYLLALYGVVLFFTEPDRMGAYFEPPLAGCSGLVDIENSLYVLNPRFNTIHRYDARGNGLDYWTIRGIKNIKICLTDQGKAAVSDAGGLYVLRSGGDVEWKKAGGCAKQLKAQQSIVLKKKRLTLSDKGDIVFAGKGKGKQVFISSGWFKQKLAGTPGTWGIGLVLLSVLWGLLGNMISVYLARILNRAQTEPL